MSVSTAASTTPSYGCQHECVTRGCVAQRRGTMHQSPEGARFAMMMDKIAADSHAWRSK